MKKIAIIITGLLFVSAISFGQKPGIGKYHSSEKQDKVFYAALQAVSTIKFSVKASDKENGTIQAEAYAGSNGKVWNLFVTIKQENGKTVVEATFTKPWGTLGNMAKWATMYGDEIKKTIVDLEIAVEDKKKN
ncbi:MAG: hypothetical protein IT249_16070 [Chitinophagaceae bacterium]|nr:hypothetical protein [Chitinophagaceae bacterium]